MELALEGDVQLQTGAACLLHADSVLLRTDAMVMRHSIAPGYATAWSRPRSELAI